MKYFFYFLLFTFYFLPTITLANCNKYELESDEVFKIQTLGSDNFLTIYSKYFDMSFFLECPKNTDIYAKIANNDALLDTDNSLKVVTNSRINNIKISYQPDEGYVKRIKFFINNEPLSSSFKNNTFYINKNNNKDMLYQLTNNDKEKSSLPLDFQCNADYFFNKHKVQHLFFENEKLNTTYIKNKILRWNTSRWKLNNNNHSKEKLVEWFINCQKWVDLEQKNKLEDVYSIDKQIILQASKSMEEAEYLLANLQKRAINIQNMKKDISQNFVDTVNALKTLEKNKSKYSIFHTINDIFYIRNDKFLKSKLEHILSYRKSHYYDLLSNSKIGFFDYSNKSKLDFMPLRLDIFTLDYKKEFLALKITNSIDLSSKRTQFAIYKLSNSFCSFLNYKIKDINKKIFNNIPSIEYCADKKFNKNYIPLNENSYSKNKYTRASFLQNKQNKKNNASNKKSECKNISNGIFCKNILRNNISSHMKNGLKMPSLNKLISSFDNEKYEGITIYAPNNKYFFFNEDIGWENVSKTDSNIIDLILVR